MKNILKMKTKVIITRKKMTYAKIFSHFPTKPFTNLREESAVSKKKHMKDEKNMNEKDTQKGDLEKTIDLDDADIFDEVNNDSDNEDLHIP